MKKTIFKYGFFSARLAATAFFVNMVLNCGCDTCTPNSPDDGKNFEIYYDALPLGSNEAGIYGVNYSKAGFGRLMENGMLFSGPNVDRIIAFSKQSSGKTDSLMYYEIDKGKAGRIVDFSVYPGISFVVASPIERKVLFADGKILYYFNMDGTGDYQLSSSLCSGTLPTFSQDGRYIAFFTGASADSAMKMFVYNSADPTGSPALETDLPFGAGSFLLSIGISWTPDSKSVVFTRKKVDASIEIIIKDVSTGNEIVIGDDNFSAAHPIISPGLDTVCFACKDGNIRIKSIGSGKIWRLTDAGSSEYYSGPSWSPDGEKIMFVRFAQNSSSSNGGILEVLHLKTGKKTIMGNNVLRAFWNR